ncbi:maleylpyruvate isomerase family mycothiol-dependent enzyme [Streptomyces sp. SID8379]|uniref:maleylpyruvate isomerase family mycothiol-dependent enzyme n=1 Tax=unclassified Streptomyces TaxID=2593676 RepID=UPI000475A61A|nr:MULTISPECIES: maleylpyruvate isomerase family mycothiol-dependent enzyme [unclassified Streptomyces]MYW66460.1 maleylpyruvate isomerase family mycothiol-dependent enzyme [Streptomyces sp. SID8379]
MSDHVRDLVSVREATDRLLAAVSTLDNAAVTEPSRLPGWSRGHVLAHLARNAEALVNVLAGRPMYASAEARDADIERDAPRGLRAQVDDVRQSAELFRRTGAEEADWGRTVELRNGVKDTASHVPFRRWIEVELHHVDLGIGYELEDLSEEFTQREINFLSKRFRNHPDLPPLLLKQDDGRMISTGAVQTHTLEEIKSGTGGPPPLGIVVQGRQADLLGWLSGRRKGSALTVDRGSLPALPPL